MTEQPVELDKVNWTRIFPWVRLFRVFGTAVELRMLLLGCIALVALAGGDAIFTSLPFAPPRSDLDSTYRWDQAQHVLRPLDVPEAVLGDPLGQLWSVASKWGAVLRPAQTIVVPLHVILQAGTTWSEKALAWTRLLWALCVWSVVAGAMTRIAAVEQARDAKISLVAALRFSLQNFLSYMTAALLPAAGVGIFWFLCMIGGLIGRLPYIGPPVLGLLWGIELVFGFMMALILIGAGAGWPLMYATISTEGSDGFDGFSRAYSYVFGRPWHYLWFGMVAVAYGAVVVTFVYFVATLVAYLAAMTVSSGLGVATTQGLLLGSADSVGGSALLTGTAAGRVGVGTVFVGIWMQVLALLVSAFVTSYFWTANTVIYFLLRQVDDATDFHEVYLPEEKETDDLLPLVGVAASEQAVIERPPQGDFAAGTNVPPEDHRPGTPSDPVLHPDAAIRPDPALRPEKGTSTFPGGPATFGSPIP